MIVDTITSAGHFRDKFREMGRSDNFSYEGLGALFEWLDDLSDSIGEPIELDVIGICCEFSEYASVEECCEQYDSEQISTLDDLADHTLVIPLPCGGVIIQDF